MKVEFCVIDHNSKMQALRKLCQLLEKPYADKERVFILTDNKEESEMLDNLLWTYREDTFLAHSLVKDNPDAPIVIGETLPDKNHGILVNLKADIPEGYQKYSKVMEFIFTDPAAQQQGRERYRQYRDQGCELQTHKMKAN